MSLISNTELEKALAEKQYDKAINIYLKANEIGSNRLKTLSKAVDLATDPSVSEKTVKKLQESLIGALTFNPPKEWLEHSFDYLIKVIPAILPEPLERANCYSEFAKHLESASSSLGKQGFLLAGEQYKLAKNYKDARTAYQHINEFSSINTIYLLELQDFVDELEVSQAINLFNEYFEWNNKYSYISSKQLLENWIEISNQTLNVLGDASNLPKNKKNIVHNDVIFLMQKDVWQWAVKLHMVNLSLWRSYFNLAIRQQNFSQVDYWIEQSIINKLHSKDELGLHIISQFSNISTGAVIQLSSLIITRFGDTSAVLKKLVAQLEIVVTKVELVESRLDIANLIIRLYQDLEETQKYMMWKIERVELLYRTHNKEAAFKEIHDIQTRITGDREFINLVDQHILDIAKFLTQSKNFNDAENVFEILINLYTSINDSIAAGKIYGEEANLFFGLEHKNANDILNRSMKLLSGHPIEAGFIQEKIGENLFHNGRENIANDFFVEANKFFHQDESLGKEAASNLGKILVNLSRQLLQDKKRRKFYDQYYDLAEKIFIDWGLANQFASDLLFEVKRLIEGHADTEAINTIAIRTGKQIENSGDIFRLVSMLSDYSTELLEKRDIPASSLISQTILGVLEEHNSMVLIKEFGLKLALAFFDLEEVVIGDDILEHVITVYENDQEFQIAGDALYKAGLVLAKAKGHDQAVARIGRAVTFYEDTNNSRAIENEVIKCLDLARQLSDKNKDEGQLYISKANDIIENTDADISETTLNMAYANYSEHLLQKSQSIVQQTALPRRKHQKKQLFAKKTKNTDDSLNI